ncbi:MAG: hypothetical protein ACRCVG_00060 [Methanobacteriaceae archaeon]
MVLKSSNISILIRYCKSNALAILGIIFIIMAILILFNNVIANLIRPITELFLMGSSKGKDLLFFTAMGFLLIITNTKYFKSQSFWNLGSYKDYSQSNNQKYLKITLILLTISLLFALILEIVMRANLPIGQLTTFVVINPETTTTSILHTHIFKSVSSNFVSDIINILSSNSFSSSIYTSSINSITTNINTGNSLYYYIPKIANIFIVLYPITAIFGLLSLKNRTVPSRLILIFTMVCGLIGLLDGGLFAVPTIIGLFGLLYIYFNAYWFNYYLLYLVNYINYNSPIAFNRKNKKFNKDNEDNKSNISINSNESKYNIDYRYMEHRYNKRYIIKKLSEKLTHRWNYNKVKKIFPLVFLILIIVLRISIGIMGTNVDYYEITILEPVNDVKLSSSLIKLNLDNRSKVNNITTNSNKTIIEISANENEIEIIGRIVHVFKDYNNYKTENKLINKVINNSSNNMINSDNSNDNINNTKINAFSISWNFYSYV